MKRLMMLSTLLLMMGSALAGETTVTLAVERMTCALCPAIVSKAINRVEGVSAVDVSFDEKTAVVTFDDATTDGEQVALASTNAGFPATLKTH